MKRDYLSYSALKAYAQSPNHYLRYVSREVAETPEMRFGTALHTYLLEPDAWHERYYVMPKVDRRTKKGKEEFEKHTELAKTRIVITEEDQQVIEAMTANVWKHEPAAFFMREEGEVEKLLERNLFDIDWKGYADKIVGNAIIDVKTVQDASPAAFQRTAHQMKYHWQAALYRMLAPNMPSFVWLAIEKKEPYNVMVFEQSDDAFLRATMEVQEATKKFLKWDGSAGSYSSKVLTLDYPSWS